MPRCPLVARRSTDVINFHLFVCSFLLLLSFPFLSQQPFLPKESQSKLTNRKRLRDQFSIELYIHHIKLWEKVPGPCEQHTGSLPAILVPTRRHKSIAAYTGLWWFSKTFVPERSSLLVSLSLTFLAASSSRRTLSASNRLFLWLTSFASLAYIRCCERVMIRALLLTFFFNLERSSVYESCERCR